MRHLIVVAALGIGLPALAQEQVYVRGQVGWGFSGSAGLSANSTPAGSLRSAGDRRNNPIPFGAAVGWNVGDGFRVEGAFEIGSMDLDVQNAASSVNGAIPTGSALQTGDPTDKSDFWNVMLNAIYDIDVGSDQPFYPYVGVGIGWGNMTVTAYNTVASTGGAATNGLDNVSRGAFAYNVLGGVAYEVSDQAAIYLEAKYFAMLSGDVDGQNSVRYATAQSLGAVYLGVLFGF